MKRTILIVCILFAVASCTSEKNHSATETLSDSPVVNTGTDSEKITITGTGSNAAITDTGNHPAQSATTNSNSQSKVNGVAGTGASDSISRSRK